MEECKSTTTPMNQKEKFCKDDGAEKVDEGLYRSLIGFLMYLTATRPDIPYAVSLLSRYMHCASEIHFQAAKRVIIQVKAQVICEAPKVTILVLVLECSLGVQRGKILWLILQMKQSTLQLHQLRIKPFGLGNYYQICIWSKRRALKSFLINKQQFQDFKIKLYFLREVQKNGDIDSVHCKIYFQTVDILIKALPRARCEFLKKKLGIAALESRRSVESGASKAGD
ncbi:uncharacterized protein LOC125857337 [Solanum stenotomum]|uniref:uncharacterized protein LOC125857337 n=1 Tax=Solanum stenotomum TaxID=172797 RepID=UPI0020D18B95|nr:uncharacterized protein LOC125857337 [Solanum stenotomum]